MTSYDLITICSGTAAQVAMGRIRAADWFAAMIVAGMSQGRDTISRQAARLKLMFPSKTRLWRSS